MGIIRDRIGTYINQRRITGLTNETKALVAQISDPRVEQQLKDSQRVDELCGKLQRLIELENRKNTRNIDRQLHNMNTQFMMSNNQLNR